MVSNYLSKQSEMTVNMRAILVDWMDEVQQNFELSHETLYLGVKLVDLYLSVEDVAKSRLQLVGATALNVASKFEVCNFSYFRNKGFHLLICIHDKLLSYQMQNCK